MTEHHITINGIAVSARYTDRAVREIFLPMLEKWTEMQKEKGKRILVMLAAPPGAGAAASHGAPGLHFRTIALQGSGMVE